MSLQFPIFSLSLDLLIKGMSPFVILLSSLHSRIAWEIMY